MIFFKFHFNLLTLCVCLFILWPTYIICCGSLKSQKINLVSAARSQISHQQGRLLIIYNVDDRGEFTLGSVASHVPWGFGHYKVNGCALRALNLYMTIWRRAVMKGSLPADTLEGVARRGCALSNCCMRRPRRFKMQTSAADFMHQYPSLFFALRMHRETKSHAFCLVQAERSPRPLSTNL